MFHAELETKRCCQGSIINAYLLKWRLFWHGSKVMNTGPSVSEQFNFANTECYGCCKSNILTENAGHALKAR